MADFLKMSSPIESSFAEMAQRARLTIDAGGDMDGVAPPGWEKSITRMKKSHDVTNPWALAWWMQRHGATPARHEDAADAAFDASVTHAVRELSACGMPIDCLAASRGELWAQAQCLTDATFVYQEQPWR